MSIEKLIVLAKQGDLLAQNALGDKYSHRGESAYKDAIYWWTKAAKGGNTDAQFKMGRCFYFGKLGVEKSFENAVYWWTKGAKQGDSDSQYALGLCYFEGNGVKQCYETAVFWWQKAAEQDNISALVALLKCYKEGKGVPADEEMVSYLLTRISQANVE